MQLSDNGYIEVYTDPREKIWAHSYAANLTAEEVLFGANAGEPAPQQAFIAELPQPENNELVILSSLGRYSWMFMVGLQRAWVMVAILCAG